ncbi:MAG TPA: type II toxin-antitoxin system RelE/ParE family toxin [Devosia sp.]|nr:type II toxin-antitoxin system RelE/ParE family toxin [Devosia sp.]
MKDVVWVGSSKDDLRGFPKTVRMEIGFALDLAQNGLKSPHAKPMAGFGSASVLEIRSVDESGTYRSVYTVKFAETVYVLHCFKKKSKRGIATPKHELDLIRERLAAAQRHSEQSKETRHGKA